MSDPKQLPHLLRLFDDDSPSVRRAVLEALARFRSRLEEELADLPGGPDAATRRRILEAVLHFERTGEVQPRTGSEDSTVSAEALFEPGQLILHRRYGYRGVCVHADPHCMADEDWYRANQTQPQKDQPWYHVLVDRSDSVTYAAQSNLQPDLSGQEVQHALLAHFFRAFEDGKYVRNGRRWPHKS